MQVTVYGIKGNGKDYVKTFTVKTKHEDGSYDFTTGHRFGITGERSGGQLVSRRGKLVARYAYAEHVGGENLLTETSKQILAALPHCTDADLKILYGRLTFNMYGATVSNECAAYVIAERNRREAIAGN